MTPTVIELLTRCRADGDSALDCAVAALAGGDAGIGEQALTAAEAVRPVLDDLAVEIMLAARTAADARALLPLLVAGQVWGVAAQAAARLGEHAVEGVALAGLGRRLDWSGDGLAAARLAVDVSVQALAGGDGELAAAASTIAAHAQRRHATRLRSLEERPAGELAGRVAVAAAVELLTDGARRLAGLTGQPLPALVRALPPDRTFAVVVVSPGSVADASLAGEATVSTDARVVAVEQRGDWIAPVGPGPRLTAGDRLLIAGPPDQHGPLRAWAGDPLI